MRKKLFIILSLILGLVFVAAGYFISDTGKAQARDENEVEEQEEIGKKAEKALEKLEKLEMKEGAPASLVITAGGKTTMVNAELVFVATTTATTTIPLPTPTPGTTTATTTTPTTTVTTTGTLTVKIFGLSFKVDATGARITGGGRDLNVSDLRVGDKLLIKGVISEDTGIIKASRIQDRSVQRGDVSAIKTRIQELMKLINELRAKLKGRGRD